MTPPLPQPTLFRGFFSHLLTPVCGLQAWVSAAMPWMCWEGSKNEH